MSYPPDNGTEMLLEVTQNATGPDDVSKYNYVSSWIPTGNVKAVSVSVAVNNDLLYVAVEHGFNDGTGDPVRCGWTQLPAVVAYTGPGGGARKATSGDVDLVGRYFRVHAIGFDSVSGASVAVRVINR